MYTDNTKKGLFAAVISISISAVLLAMAIIPASPGLIT